jgi:hypothetical protein
MAIQLWLIYPLWFDYQVVNNISGQVRNFQAGDY